MSTHPKWTITCDFGGCHESYQNGARTNSLARLYGLEVGWAIGRGRMKLDFCPRHAKADANAHKKKVPAQEYDPILQEAEAAYNRLTFDGLEG